MRRREVRRERLGSRDLERVVHLHVVHQVAPYTLQWRDDRHAELAKERGRTDARELKQLG